LKKFTSIILIMLLAANVCGASISYHYCGKIFQYFAFNSQKKKSKCCCGGTQEKKGCCKTKHCKFKVDNNQSFAKQLNFDKQFVVEAAIPATIQIVQQNFKLVNIPYAIPLVHSPPLIRTVAIHILHQQFLI
jgi:hypothetical protein